MAIVLIVGAVIMSVVIAAALGVATARFLFHATEQADEPRYPTS